MNHFAPLPSHPPPASRPPPGRPVRSASLNGFGDLVQSLGRDPKALLSGVGLRPQLLHDPETLISSETVRQLLENAAHATGHEDFALRLAERRSLANLGPISLVLREEPTPRQALDTLCRYLRLLNASLSTHIEDCGDTVLIREEFLTTQAQSMRQSMELAVGTMLRILCELIGPHWRPRRVCFTHRSPDDTLNHRRFFGAPVDFNQPFNGLVCEAADLHRPQSQETTGMARFAREYLDAALLHRGEGTTETVRQLVLALLPGGRCTAQQLARHLGIDRRTLHRHLVAEGADFTQLLSEVRSDLAQRHLRDSDLPVGDIADLLGFSSASAFSHWFRKRFGCSVRQWRKQLI